MKTEEDEAESVDENKNLYWNKATAHETRKYIKFVFV